MARWKRLLSLCLLLVLLAAVPAAAQADYGYVSRIFTGNQGTIGGKTLVDGAVSFDVSDVKLKSDKYIVRGIRESGKGDGTLYTYLPTAIDHDTDYVVVYGLKNDAVTLTIRYVDENGDPILPPRTLYANVNDKPRVQAAYREDYTPVHPFITGTLTEDAVWTFEYKPTAQDEEGGNNGGNNAGNNGGNNAGNNGGTNAGTNGTYNGNPVRTSPTPAAQNTPVPISPQTEEVLDLDVPQSGMEPSEPTPAPQQTESAAKAHKLYRFAVVAGAVSLLVLLGLLYWYLLFYRKKKRNEDAERGKKSDPRGGNE